MGRAPTVVLFSLAVVAVVVSPSVVPAAAADAATEPMDPVETSDGVETPGETQTTSPAEPTPTPDDGPDGHADDPFPRWLPLAFAGGLVGIAVVGGGLWVAFARLRRFLGGE